MGGLNVCQKFPILLEFAPQSTRVVPRDDSLMIKILLLPEEIFMMDTAIFSPH
jgi:hypothetical protein